jgi:4-hydroxy-tetrahydrodipicolinate synthase
LITPFKENGDVDYGLLKNEVEYQINEGIAGLFTNGLASESLSLDADELVQTTKTVINATNGRVHVMANIASNSLPEAKKILKGYEESGVSAVCIQPPCVYTCSQLSLYKYFDDLAKSTKLPVGVYNAPQSGNTLSPETVANIFHENNNVHYYKESTLDFVHIQNTIRSIGSDWDIDFLNGSDATTLSVMQLGGKGVISLISVLFPKTVQAICDAVFAGDMKRAWDAQNFVLQIRDALKTGPFVAGYKYAAGLIGVPLGFMRKPLGELSSSEKDKIKENLIKLQLVNA